MESFSRRPPLVTRIDLDRIPERRPTDTEYATLSSRRDCCSVAIPETTYETSPSEEPLTTSRRELTSRREFSREDSKAVAGAMRALQARVKSLESENRRLRETIAALETKSDSDREAWKKRLMDEVAQSKSREIDLINKFQKLDLKLKAESRRIKKVESSYKDAEAELSVKLEQAHADRSALEIRCKKLEADYKAVLAEKDDLEQRCEAQSIELQALKDHFTPEMEKTVLRSSDPPEVSPTFEDLDAAEAPSHPAPTNGFLEEIRREIQEARESASRPRSVSPLTQETHRSTYDRGNTSADLKRSSSLQTFRQGSMSDRYSKSIMDYSRLLSMPNSPLVFNPARSTQFDGPRVSFQSARKPVLVRGVRRS